MPPDTNSIDKLPHHGHTHAAKRPLLSDYIYQTWLPQSGYRVALPLELEHDHQLCVPVVAAG